MIKIIPATHSKLRLIYDAILNPPYIPPSDIDNPDPDIRRPHPNFCKRRRNEFHKILIDQRGFLNPGGAICEADEYQRPAIEALLKDTKWTYEFWGPIWAGEVSSTCRKSNKNKVLH